ncbi:MAG: hypothetical protein LBN39_00375 [Planctomycetaceae bacterium]|jgi:hypothetical protein|nr:hypothetical protein [Planctomycetaceae bacterium]
MTNTKSARKNNARSLHIESLEAREMLSVNPLLPGQFGDSDQVAAAEVPFQVEEAESTTLTGLTLNITAANYAELNAQYDFANVTSIALTSSGGT